MINDEYTKSSQTSTISSSSELYYEETSKPKITVLGDDTTHKVRENSYKIYTAVGIFGLFILFAASLFCFVRYKRQRRLNYYDNCTVAMTRMAPDGAKSSNQSLEYRMLAWETYRAVVDILIWPDTGPRILWQIKLMIGFDNWYLSVMGYHKYIRNYMKKLKVNENYLKLMSHIYSKEFWFRTGDNEHEWRQFLSNWIPPH